MMTNTARPKYTAEINMLLRLASALDMQDKQSVSTKELRAMAKMLYLKDKDHPKE